MRALRPGLMNEAKLGRSTDDLGWDRPHPEIPTLLTPDVVTTANGLRGVGSVYLPGSPAFYAYRNRNKTWEMLDNLTWARGRHVFTAGGGLLLRSSDGFLTAGRDGEYRFGSVFSFSFSTSRIPVPDRGFAAAAADLQQPDFNREYRYNQYFLFAQDTFKATSRLALNYGLRYEQYGAPRNTGAVKDAHGATGSRARTSASGWPAQMVYPGPGDQQLYKPDKNDWAVRFGFSYDLLGNARTLVRGAYGIFYDRPYDNLWQNVRTNNLSILPFNLRGTVELPGARFRRAAQDAGRQFSRYGVPESDAVRSEPARRLRAQLFLRHPAAGVSDNWSVEVNTLGSLGRKLIVTDIVNRP